MSKIRTNRGFTRAEDAAQAARLGVDAAGLVHGSRRFVTIEAGAGGGARFAAVCERGGFVVNETEARIREVLRQAPVDIIQFHGDEPPEFCCAFERHLKAVRVRHAQDIAAAAAEFAMPARFVGCLCGRRIWRYRAALHWQMLPGI